MKYKFEQLKPELEIYRDRTDDYSRENEYAYIECLKIHNFSENKWWMNRLSLFVSPSPSKNSVWNKEFHAKVANDEIGMTQESWKGWAQIEFYTKDEIRKIIIGYIMEDKK